MAASLASSSQRWISALTAVSQAGYCVAALSDGLRPYASWPPTLRKLGLLRGGEDVVRRVQVNDLDVQPLPFSLQPSHEGRNLPHGNVGLKLCGLFLEVGSKLLDDCALGFGLVEIHACLLCCVLG